MDEDEVLALPSLEQKFDPMMDSGDSDLPDLEELPAPGAAQLEVCEFLLKTPDVNALLVGKVKTPRVTETSRERHRQRR